MYAVIKSGGKQYPVREGSYLSLEKIDALVGSSIELDQVLSLVDDSNTCHIGQPFLSGCKVLVEVVEHYRGKKVRIIKMKRRKHHMKRQGHRQFHTKVKITKIVYAAQAA